MVHKPGKAHTNGDGISRSLGERELKTVKKIEITLLWSYEHEQDSFYVKLRTDITIKAREEWRTT